jgi:tetratricopeptide (TPR) repeat protein
MFSGTRTALKLLVFTFLLFTTAMAKAEPRTLLNEGINAYQQGQWDTAREKFSQLLGEQRWQFVGLYNLGNVAMRQKHLGEALGFYRRALNLKPQDSDTWFNYRFVLNSLPNRPAFNKLSSYEYLRQEFLSHFSFNQSLIVLFFASLFLLWNLLKYVRKYKAGREEDKGLVAPSPMLIVWGILFLVTLVASSLKLVDSYTERGTIVITKVDLRSGPGENNASMLELSEGIEVIVQSSVNGWKQVSQSSGLTGWIPDTTLMLTSGGGPW